MIKQLVKLTGAMGVLLTSIVSNAQTTTSTFDSLNMGVDGYWNGSDMSGGFQDGEAFFENTYDTAWSSWSGFSYSNLVDDSTADFVNQYSTFAAEGYNGSANFAVANINTYSQNLIHLNTTQSVQGFYVTNSTYAALSMRDGDMIGKAFGADTLTNGSDTNHLGEPVTGADWFTLTVFGVVSDSIYRDDSVVFYLADYRSAVDANDYIVDTWEWVDLNPLGAVDGLHFELNSSDVGAWGMNTPSYFCMDNLVVGEPVDSYAEFLEATVSLYPNPAQDRLTLKIPESHFHITITDHVGRVVAMSQNQKTMDISMLDAGMYVASITVEGEVINKRFVKQ